MNDDAMEHAEVIGCIAAVTARAGAVNYYEQECNKPESLSVDVVVLQIAGDIGVALYDAGYCYGAIDAEARKAIARQALRSVGYPGSQEVQ